MAKPKSTTAATEMNGDNWDEGDWAQAPSRILPAWNNEGVFIGTYDGFKENVEVPDAFTKGDTRMATVLNFTAITPCETEEGDRIAAGEKVAVWGGAKLLDILQLPVGSKVRIERKGEQKLSGGRIMKDYDIKFQAPKVEVKHHKLEGDNPTDSAHNSGAL